MYRNVGKTIKNDLINAYGVTVVPARTTLKLEHIDLLEKHGIDPYSIIFLPDKEGNRALSCSRMVAEAVEASRDLFDSFKYSRKIPVAAISKEILPLVQEAAGHSDIFGLFEAVRAKDDYTYRHNIGVGIISTMIGRWLNMTEPELSVLALAGTLHDVGKVKLPTELLNKPDKLTADEYELVKKHAIFGYEMLKETEGVSHRVALVALQHHERNDGNGYPYGLKKDQIDRYSKIVAVADVFHAMSSKRPYHAPVPFYEIISQMRQGIFGEFDPNIVTVFLENIVKRMVGRSVVLTDGRIGEVVCLNPQDIRRPLIKVEEEFIDLSKENELHIREIHFY